MKDNQSKKCPEYFLKKSFDQRLQFCKMRQMAQAIFELLVDYLDRKPEFFW